jgi:hypothetical protein
LYNKFSFLSKNITKSTSSRTQEEKDLEELFNLESITESPSKSDLEDETTNKLNTSSNSSTTSSATRRCLFTKTNSKLNSALFASTYSPKIVKQLNMCIESTSISSITPKTKPTTPISCYKSIIASQNDSISEENTSLIDFSLNTIEKSLFQTQNKCETIQEEVKEKHETIMNLLDMECSSTSAKLIGDRSAHHILPCTNTNIKHADLQSISPQTMSRVLHGDYVNMVDKLIIIDSRYPYEFEGGHIRQAQNIYTKEKLLEMFMHDEHRDEMLRRNDTNKRVIIIFHCEFSSERGPGMLRFLRSQDRAANKEHYPKLYYPELYLLEGGYKAFFEQYPQLCDPHTYKPMLHVDHVHDLKHFRAKTKTWEIQNKHASITATAYKCTTARLSKLQRCPRSTLF